MATYFFISDVVPEVSEDGFVDPKGVTLDGIMKRVPADLARGIERIMSETFSQRPDLSQRAEWKELAIRKLERACFLLEQQFKGIGPADAEDSTRRAVPGPPELCSVTDRRSGSRWVDPRAPSSFGGPVP